MKLSQRTVHVARVLEEIKKSTFDALDNNPDNFTDDDLENIIVKAYSTVAHKHNVTEGSVRDACVRKSGLETTSQFTAMVRRHLFGQNDLVKQLQATCKTNETPSNIANAFNNI